MELLGRVTEDAVMGRRLPPVEHARLTNAAARLFDVSQAGCLTLQRMKTGGKQHVVVQHVNVEQGGQVVVAGRLEGGRRARWIHGARSREVRELLKANRQRWRTLRALLEEPPE